MIWRNLDTVVVSVIIINIRIKVKRKAIIAIHHTIFDHQYE